MTNEENNEYRSGIYGRAEVRFGGKIFVDAVTFHGMDGRDRHGLTLAEFYTNGEVGAPPADQRIHEAQVFMVFDNIRSVEMVEQALMTIREDMKRDAEQQPVEQQPEPPTFEESQGEKKQEGE